MNKQLIHNNVAFICKSLLAGIVIGFGDIAYLLYYNENKIIGAFLFSIALLVVIMQGLNLYTGKIGYATKKTILPILGMAVFNCIGIWLFGQLIRLTSLNLDTVHTIVNNKAMTDDLTSFILAICCGAMMYFAVDNFKKHGSPLFVIIPIMCFILCGFEHCIADMGYFSISNKFDIIHIKKLTLFIAGNGIGSLLFSKCNFDPI